MKVSPGGSFAALYPLGASGNLRSLQQPWEPLEPQSDLGTFAPLTLYPLPLCPLGPQAALGAFSSLRSHWNLNLTQGPLPPHPLCPLGASGSLGSLQQPLEPLEPSPPLHFRLGLRVPTTCDKKILMTTDGG